LTDRSFWKETKKAISWRSLTVATIQVDSDKLIEAILAEHSRQGIEWPANLKQQTRQIIDSMPDDWRFRLKKLMNRILSPEMLRVTQQRIEQSVDGAEDCEILADHHKALGEIHMLIAEYLKTMLKRRVN
jgi:hypothetical protein